MKKDSKILVCGGSGLVGSAIIKELQDQGYTDVSSVRRRGTDNTLEKRYSVNLELQDETDFFLRRIRPEYVFIAAATVGGILANSKYPVQFLSKNLRMELNTIEGAYQNDVEKILFLGSSCIYPRDCPQPIKESDLLTGPLEPTNEAYALAKIAGIKLMEYYCKQYHKDGVCLMPCNLYGPNDNFDSLNSHVIPGMIDKFHKAKIKNDKEVTLWGTGKPKREFLHSSDLARAAILMMNYHSYQDTGEILYNVGSGKEYSIRQLAIMISSTVGYWGEIKWDTNFPDGTPRKIMSTQKFENFLYDQNLIWEPKIDMVPLLKEAYQFYLGENDAIAQEKKG